MKTYIVYKHQSRITGKVYIGITCQNPIKRWGAGNNYRGCLHFYAAILKYGWDSFDHIILYDSLSKDEAITIMVINGNLKITWIYDKGRRYYRGYR